MQFLPLLQGPLELVAVAVIVFGAVAFLGVRFKQKFFPAPVSETGSNKPGCGSGGCKSCG